MISTSNFKILLWFKELYEYRSILRSLVVKNLFGRYKNSYLGFGWHFIMPAVMMLVYYIVFTEIRVGILPNFWIYLSAGLFPFNFMLSCLTTGSGSIISNGMLIKKIYFPRELTVLSQVISSFIVMAIGYGLVISIVILSGFSVNGFLLSLLPFVFGAMVVFVFGYSLFFSAITVYVRDVQYMLTSLSMVFFFLTPMYFTVSNISGVLETLVWLNPFTYYVEFCHYVVYYGELPSINICISCFILPIVTLLVGLFTFNRLKRGFVERL